MSKHTSSEDKDQPVKAEDVELWGREISHEEFVEGHYGASRHEPTPEGGQAGIAQGNPRRPRRGTTQPPRA